MKRMESWSRYILSVAVIALIIPTEIIVQATDYQRFYLKALKGSFSSPNYPNKYPRDIYYEWILPSTSKGLQLEFIKMDLGRCFRFNNYKFPQCKEVDHIFIQRHKSYCNWDRPPKTIILKPWTQTAIVFYSYAYNVSCTEGNGFKVKYKPFDGRQQYETSPKPTPSTRPTMVVNDHDFFTSRNLLTDALSNGHGSHPSFSTILLLALLALPLILIMVCVYWCCRKSSRSSSSIVNQEVIQPDVNNVCRREAQSVRDRAIQNSNNQSQQQSLFLTVDIPTDRQPQPQPRIGYFDQRQANYPTGIINEAVIHDPPPSYEEIWENDSRSRELDSPPSYEAVISETTRQSQESVNQATESENPSRLNLEPNNSREANSWEIYV